jgi:hypothetical protein
MPMCLGRHLFTAARVVAMSLALLLACLGGVAQAEPLAALHVSLSPKRLGASTTMFFSFSIRDSAGGLPPALTVLDVRLPPGMTVNTAGLAACTPRQIARGPGQCPANSRVGGGTVRVEVPLGNVVRPETAVLSVFNSEVQGGRHTLLFYAKGRLPIATQLIFTGVMIPSMEGLTIEAGIPLIPTLPESPDAAIVEMSSTLGTLQFAYYRGVGRKRIRFHPSGSVLPGSCPTGGMPFTGGFRFNDTSMASAQITVACPGG